MIADGRNRFMMAGLNSDIIRCWKECHEKFKNQPQKLVSSLQGRGTTDQKCQAIFAYMVNNTRYELDETGKQYIKSPARFLADGYGDCKSYTMFITSCLYCLGIPYIARFVNFDGGNQYTHVYPVAIDEYGNEIIMDACELDENRMPIYNYAREYSKKNDIKYNC